VACLVTPFFVSSNTFFPFIVTKATVFRVLVELMLLLYVMMIVRGEAKLRLNALTIVLLIYGLAVLLSAFFGVNLIWSLLSGCERMEGVIGVWHFIIFFLIITNVFTREDFEQLIKIEIGISTFYGILALLIYKGIMTVGSVSQTPRLSGLTGNPSYLATYFIFNAFLALYLYFDSFLSARVKRSNSNDSKITSVMASLFPRNDSIWWLLIFIFDALLVFISGTRGGMIGLGVGILYLIFNFLISSQKQLIIFKKLSLIVLGVIIIFLITVFSLKNTSLVKNNFALSRLTSISYKDPTGMSRILSAQTAFKSFLEKPIFGWGIENYEPAYLKNFNPEVVKVLPGDFYFDRAHNKVMEVLATTGLVGFIPYIGIFVVVFLILNHKRKEEDNFILAVVLESLIIAYFVQNIFLFDFHESYLMFFLVLGFINQLGSTIIRSENNSVIASETKQSTTSSRSTKDSLIMKKEDSSYKSAQDFTPQLLKGFILIATFCLVIFSLSQIVLKTYFISRGIITVARLAVSRNFDEALTAFKDVNYRIGKLDNLRKDLVIGTYNILGSYNIINEKAEPLMQNLLQLTDDLLKKEPWNYRLIMDKLQLVIYESNWDKSKLEEAQQIRDELVKAAPYFPQTYLASAKLNFLLNKPEEARLDLEKVLELDPNNSVANYLMGYYYNLNKDSQNAFNYFIKALDAGYSFNDPQLIQNLVNILSQQKDYERIAKLYLQLLNLDPKNPEVYVHLAATYAKLHDKNKAIEYARMAMDLDPKYKEAALDFIQKVEKGEWDKIPD
jgi:O-antigen ligase/tetratricopeptide (TPR) repeat protein